MNFDPERVLALAKALDFPRPSGSPGERRAGDDMARQFELAGLRVERVRSPSLLVARPILLLILLYLGLTVVRYSRPWPAGLSGLFLVGIVLTWIWAARRDQRAGNGLPADHVIGETAHEVTPPARVVLVTSLASPSDLFARQRGMISFIGLLVLLAIASLTPVSHAIRTRPWLGIALVSAVGLAAFLLILTPRCLVPFPFKRWDRTGLAVLAELARTRPKGLEDRVGTWFVATPNASTLDRYIGERSREVAATLVITLDAPGVGAGLVIEGRGPAADLAREAARDLWIPHRPAGILSAFVDPAPGIDNQTGFGLAGAGDDRAIDPATLTATAQLVSEVVLRWLKCLPSVPGQGESLARSSQKPG